MKYAIDYLQANSMIAFKFNSQKYSFTTHMLFNFFIEWGVLVYIPDITSAFGFAHGPLFYLYLKEITQSDFKINIYVA